MKTNQYYFILAVVTVILSVAAVGKIEQPLDKYEPLLIGQAHPELAGMDKLHVVIIPTDAEGNKDALLWKELRAKVENKLEKAGITIISESYVDHELAVGELRVDVDILKLKDLQKNVFRIQTLLSRAVYLKGRSRLLFKANVWKTEPVMKIESVQNMPVTVSNIVLEQIEVFIGAWRAANPKGVWPADANQVGVNQRELIKPAAKSEVAEYKYVSSKNSKVFHMPECHWVEQIKPENMIGYNSRDEAVKDGKRPCKVCNP